MPNTSASGGYLVPTSTAPLDGDALDAFLQAFVVGITGLPGNLVRPRWQAVPPKRPESTVDWCAIGVTDTTVEYGAYFKHHRGTLVSPDDPAGSGYDEMQRHETLEVTATFYGPSSGRNARQFRDGLAVPQNHEVMYFQGMNLVSTDCAIGKVPELINETWFQRVDLSFCVRRAVVRTYPILNILEASGEIITDSGHEQDFKAGPNPP